MANCPNCGFVLDTEEDNDALAADEQFDYFCAACGELYVEADLDVD